MRGICCNIKHIELINNKTENIKKEKPIITTTNNLNNKNIFVLVFDD